jgi:hypothetical protein
MTPGRPFAIDVALGLIVGGGGDECRPEASPTTVKGTIVAERRSRPNADDIAAHDCTASARRTARGVSSMIPPTNGADRVSGAFDDTVRDCTVSASFTGSRDPFLHSSRRKRMSNELPSVARREGELSTVDVGVEALAAV